MIEILEGKKKYIKELVRKIIYLPLIVLFINSIIISFFSAKLLDIYNAAPIFILNIFLVVDISIRRRSIKKDRFKIIILIIAFLIFPFLVAAPLFEQRIVLSIFQNNLFSTIFFVTGIILEILGGIMLLIGRITLGQFGTTSIAIEDKHRLLTKGIYRYIRNPIYLGIICLVFGYALALKGFISAIISTSLITIICIKRMKEEENMLEEAFGVEYIKYKKRTKRFIPFVY